MRKPAYLSPSALAQYLQDKDQFYLDRLADCRPPRMKQTLAMAIGSSFDAYVKSFLHKKVYGGEHKDSVKYDLNTIFDSQVEIQNRDQCKEIGHYLFEKYKESGALGDLMLELQGAVDDPTFEFTVQGVINGAREGINKLTQGVPLLGKPDIRFVNSEAANVTTDWKVNGWVGKGNTSPMQGYVELREQNSFSDGDWSYRGHHKEAYCVKWKGIKINVNGYLEQWNPDWARQLATYSWLLGTKVGVEEVIGIDQLVCNCNKKNSKNGYPILRIASHRTRISSAFQFETMNQYQELWGIITEEPFYYFRDLSFEQSQLKCKMLEDRAKILYNSDVEMSEEERLTLDWGGL